MKGAGVPQVAKRWKTDPKYAPKIQNFTGGYAMKLELGQLSEGMLGGKIFLALPDQEQSVAAGVFKAATTQVQASAAATTTEPGPAAAPDPAAAAQRAAFEKRYGIKR